MRVMKTRMKQFSHHLPVQNLDILFGSGLNESQPTTSTVSILPSSSNMDISATHDSITGSTQPTPSNSRMSSITRPVTPVVTQADDTDNSEDSSENNSEDDGDEEWKKVQFPHIPPTEKFDEILLRPSQFFPNRSSPRTYFNVFLNDEVLLNIVDQTNLYAAQNRQKDWDIVTLQELKAFFGILILMGIHVLPNISLYWSSDPMFRVAEIANVMTVKRFKKILANLHLNDNSQMPKRGEEGSYKLAQTYKKPKKKKDEPKPPPLVLAKGEYKWRVNQNVAFFVWKDTKLVYVLSTAYHPRQKTTCRRTQKDGSKSDVSCPIGILEYTKRMGGVDRFDQKRGTYSISRRSKRWWMRIFYFLVDSAITNAYIIYTQNDRVHNPMTSLHFRTVLARNLIDNFSSRKRTVAQSPNFVTKKPKGPTSRQKAIHGIPDELRLNDVGSHMPMELPKYRRCRACSSKNLNKTSKIQCTKCQVPLCIVPCFAQFHTP
ncbi:unnamed protein product [Parnassius apollo]|uniref:(apollo) hypothetical protein n=1 Tax=Parnassius apollo TaxID=110799 RepID=A0A8S3X6G5_PARAO|nr:unnamed protein product [Parnassius apollo]